MKRVFWGFVAAAVIASAGASSARAQELTKADKDRAMQYLETTKKNVQEATKGLSAAQWNFKPGPDRWSVAEVTEHIAAAEDLLRGMVQDKIMKEPANATRDLKKKDDEG